MYIKIYYKKNEGEEYIYKIQLQDWMDFNNIIEGSFDIYRGRMYFKFYQVHSEGEFEGVIDEKWGMEKGKEGDTMTREYKLKSFGIKGCSF